MRYSPIEMIMEIKSCLKFVNSLIVTHHKIDIVGHPSKFCTGYISDQSKHHLFVG